MAGFANSPSGETIMWVDNLDFSGAVIPTTTVTINGQLLIGSTATPHIKVGTLISPLGTLTIGYSDPNITLDLAGGASAIERVALQTGTTPVVPAGGTLTFNGAVVAAGTNPVRTDGTGANTMALEVQISQAIAAADATKIGLSNFNSAGFTVAATGFVSQATSVAQLFTANTGTATPSSNNLNVLGGGGIQTSGSGATLTIAVSGGGFTWTDVTTATQSLAVQNGYFTDRGAGVTYTLPATAALGDVIKIDGKLGLTTIAQNANQAIRMSSALSTTGVGGSVVGTNVGDCITLRCSTAGASTIWIAENFVGNWTVT